MSTAAKAPRVFSVGGLAGEQMVTNDSAIASGMAFGHSLKFEVWQTNQVLGKMVGHAEFLLSLFGVVTQL